MGCYCDYEPPEFVREEHFNARKQHECCECLGKIEPGESYRVVSGKWDGHFDQFKTCEQCLRVLLMVDCQCIPFGELHEELNCSEYEGIDFAERFKSRRYVNFAVRRKEWDKAKESKRCQESH
jgi:hypothetical protein